VNRDAVAHAERFRKFSTRYAIGREEREEEV
jgi:hypothetical protein